MKPVAFEYARPRDVGAALAALRDGGDAARPLAGGQSLGPMLNLRIARPSLLVDLGRIAELRAIERRGDAWHVGAMVTHAMLEDDAAGMGGPVPVVARGIAYRAVRNRGTIGGSLAHADPAGDWPLALAALGATVQARSVRGLRDVSVETLARNAFSTTLAPDEIIVSVKVPVLSARARWGYVKTCRKAGELADAAAAVLVDPDRGISRVVLGALGRPAHVLQGSTTLVAHGVPPLQELEAAVRLAAPELDPIEVRLQAGTLAKALAQVKENA